MGPNRDYAAVVHAVISLAHNLGAKVTAEGIEDADQLAQLLSLDCDFGQGYFFAKPLRAEEAWELIESRKSWRLSA